MAGPERAGAIRSWAQRVGQAHTHLDPIDLTAAVADRVALELGGGPVTARPPVLVDLDGAGSLPAEAWEPWLVGAVHELAVGVDDRRARGAWYTPRSVVEGLVAVAFETAPGDGGWAAWPERVIDPTCGAGGFLLAALDGLVARGLAPAEAVGRIGGMDLDPGAVEVARWSIQLWLGSQLGSQLGPEGGGWVEAGELAARADLVVGDALVDWPSRWRARVLVVGNPPFASPLKRGAVPEVAARYRAEWGELLGPYADLGAIHLWHAVASVADGSTVALVQPQSVLASRDTEGLRAHLGEVAPLEVLWAAREAVFDAGVRACAPILAVGGAQPTRVGLLGGPDAAPVGSTGPDTGWAEAAAEAVGAPRLTLDEGQRLGSMVTATAGFRDEHYGLVGACREASGDELVQPLCESVGVGRVVTVGSVDPLTITWGRSPIRFGGSDWHHPVVDLDNLPPKVERWCRRLAQPKILLATQAKILEPVVDRRGDLVPATPLIAVLAPPDQLDRVAAVLLAPPVSLWAWRRWFGAALSVNALKLAASQVGELPLPPDDARWAQAAALLADRDQGADPDPGLGLDPARAWDVADEVAALMTDAYQADPDVLAWWRSRRPPRPTP